MSRSTGTGPSARGCSRRSTSREPISTSARPCGPTRRADDGVLRVGALVDRPSGTGANRMATASQPPSTTSPPPGHRGARRAAASVLDHGRSRGRRPGRRRAGLASASTPSSSPTLDPGVAVHDHRCRHPAAPGRPDPAAGLVAPRTRTPRPESEPSDGGCGSASGHPAAYATSVLGQLVDRRLHRRGARRRRRARSSTTGSSSATSVRSSWTRTTCRPSRSPRWRHRAGIDLEADRSGGRADRRRHRRGHLRGLGRGQRTARAAGRSARSTPVSVLPTRFHYVEQTVLGLELVDDVAAAVDGGSRRLAGGQRSDGEGGDEVDGAVVEGLADDHPGHAEGGHRLDVGERPDAAAGDDTAVAVGEQLTGRGRGRDRRRCRRRRSG